MCQALGLWPTRNYESQGGLLEHNSVRLAPLYDLNSHLAYSDGRGNHLSMQVNGQFGAAALSVDDWIAFAPKLRVDQDWIRDEI